MLRAPCHVGLKHRGFSLVETVMTLAIGLILASVGLPMIVSAVEGYRLNSVVQQTANLVNMTRYAAIRRNALVSFRTTTQGANTVFYVDLKGNGVLDAMDPLVMLPADMQIANGQALTPSASSTGISQTQDFSTQIMFDSRGTVYYPLGSTATYFLAIGYTNQAQYGTRAVTVTPMGQTKMWTAPPSGTWTGM
jgi:prepilin-type N-terminal cleavage/methylation domain-containing protein